MKDKSLSVLEFDAVGDGKTLNTVAIQKAIDACALTGGGEVYFPAGQYLTGTFRIRNHVTLHLDPQAVILGSTDLADYPQTELTITYGLAEALIVARDVEQIGISGKGTINGQGWAFPCGTEGFNFEDEEKAPEGGSNRAPT